MDRKRKRGREGESGPSYGEVGCFSHELTMHRGDSFGSRLEDFTSAFHICNDREGDEEARKETNTERERETTEKVKAEEKGDLNPGRSDRERRRRTRKVGEKKRRKTSERQGPHLDAWDRHPRSLHQRTDSHRAHAALTYSRVLRRGDRLSW